MGGVRSGFSLIHRATEAGGHIKNAAVMTSSALSWGMRGEGKGIETSAL